MQVYAMKFFNFLRFGEKNNTIVFDLSEKEKEDLKHRKITLDEIYERVLKNPVKHIKEVKERGMEGLLGIVGVIDGDPDTSNGCGKSSILEGICFANYEKIVRKTANTDKVEKAGLSVVTKIDRKYPKNLQESYVEEIFENDGRVYRIKRGRTFSKNQKSNTPVLEFECINENSVDSQAGHRTSDTKEAISDVITMDYDIFVNSQMFGQNDAGKYLMGTDKTRKEMLISLLRLENVVSGCLELIRTKKNAQDKKVDSIKSNIELLEKIFCDGYVKICNKTSEGFQEEYVNAIFSHIELARIETNNQIRSLGKDIIEIDKTILDLSRSDKISKVALIKEEGAKVTKDKKQKEQEMVTHLSDWEKLKQDCLRTKIGKEDQKKTLIKKETDIANKISETKLIVEKFNKTQHEERMEIIQKAKKANPIWKEKLGKFEKERDSIVEEISKLNTLISTCKKEIDKFDKQLANCDEKETLICSECRSVVDKAHLIAKSNENVEKRDKLTQEKIISEQLKVDKEKEIKEAKDKLQKINEYLIKESQMISEINAYENGKKAIDELGEQLKQTQDWKTTITNEISDIEIKIKEYEDKLISIRSIYEKDIEALKQRINSLVEQLNNAEADAKGITAQIEDFKLKNKEATQKQTKLLEKVGYLDKEKEGYENQRVTLDEKRKILQEEAKILQRFLCLEDVFGLDGIQTMIVKKYLPLLNVYIKEFLDILSNGLMTVKMIINDKSKVDMIISGGTADTFEMLSGGEQMIVRLATDIGLALLAFSKSSQKPELICLDEIFSPLDKSHTDAVFKMLKKLQDKFNRVLIISHKTEIKEMLKTNIIIEKSAGKMGMSEIRRIE